MPSIRGIIVGFPSGETDWLNLRDLRIVLCGRLFFAALAAVGRLVSEVVHATSSSARLDGAACCNR